MKLRKLLVWTAFFAFHTAAQPASSVFTNVSVIDVVAGQANAAQLAIGHLTGIALARSGDHNPVSHGLTVRPHYSPAPDERT